MKRWLLWNLRCLRGRRCADVIIEGEIPPQLDGAVPTVEYTCGGCTTRYRWDMQTRRRQRVLGS